MAINKVNILDEIKDFAGKYNDTSDEIVISGLVNGSNQLELTKNGGGIITINLPFSNDKIISGLDITIAGVGPYTASVSAGTYQINGVPYTYIGGGFPIAITIFPDERIDILYADNSNNVFYLAGLAGPIPIQPNTPLGTLLIGIVYVNSASAGASAIPTVVGAGFIEGQTLRWNNTTNEWIPTGQLNVSNTGQVGIGGFPTGNARLEINGAVELNPILAPIPVTDKLYNVLGDLYWNGALIGISDGTITGSHLYWDGVNWVENIDLLRITSSGGFSEDILRYNTTDLTGIQVDFIIGDDGIERGIDLNVVDTLNNFNSTLNLIADGSQTSFQLLHQDTVNLTNSIISSNTTSIDLSVIDITNDDGTTITQNLNGITTISSSRAILDPNNFSNIIVSSASPIKPLVSINSETVNYTTNLVISDTLNCISNIGDLTTVADFGLSSLTGERGVEFKIADALNGANGDIQFVTRSGINSTSEFKIAQEDATNSDNTFFLLNAYSNEIRLSNVVNNKSWSFTQSDTNGNQLFSSETGVSSATIKQSPTENYLTVIDTATPTTYSSTTMLEDKIDSYLNSANPNLICLHRLELGKFRINGGLVKRYRNTAINTTIVENDYMIVTTANPLTLTLPLAPVDGQELIFKAISANGGNPITISGNGKNINGGATTTITTNYGTTTMIFNNSLNIWLSV